MNSSKLGLPLRLLFLSLLSSIASGCGGGVKLLDEHPCTVAGTMSAGGICSHTTNASTNDLSLNEMIDFLEPQAKRHCVPIPGMNVCADDQTHGTAVDLPARGGAIAESAADWIQKKTELEQACRLLGDKCTIDNQRAIQGMGTILKH